MQASRRFLWICAALWCAASASGRLAADDLSAGAAAARDKLFAELAADVEELERRGNVLKRVVKLVRPSIVHIEAKRDADGSRLARGEAEEAGSGVIIESHGKPYVLTNRHVIRYSTLAGIHVRLADSRILTPTRVWADPATDVALLSIAADDLVPARVGDSSKMEMGDFVLAVGSPFGLSHSVSYGIISAKGRRDLQLGDDGLQYQDFLQTDAAINPGNSGGPLLNLRGELIGINTAIASSSGANEGVGFAIPINMVMTIAGQLVEHGVVQRSYLGVRLDASFAQPQGARVSGITRNSPAELARILIGDVIVEFDGTRIEDDMHLINLVSLTPVNKEVEVRLLRNGRPVQVRLRVANRSQMPAE
ncbi:MAG TPA: trypsin-like peptidase domain-containing protein [Pirellulaceae bacterium]|nr:trypsin-like peptidase domain-containing protein [Pirellulaceae bacterium]